MTPEATALYNSIIGDPDKELRQQDLDKLVPLLIREGMERAAIIAKNDDTDCEHADHHCGCTAGIDIAHFICQVAKEVK